MPQVHTIQANATLRCILEKLADHMPHRFQTLASSDKVVSKVLSAIWKWKESILELNSINSTFGLKEILSSNLSKFGS
jgi:hypothetical protein